MKRSNRAVSTQLGLVLGCLSLLIGCGGQSTADKSTPPSQAATAASKSTATVATAASFLPCSFSDASNLCEGVANTRNPTSLTWEEAKALRKSFDQRQGKLRQISCPGEACRLDQYANTFVNPDSRRFPDLATLGDRSLLVGLLRLKEGEKTDRLYTNGTPYQADPGFDKAFIYFFARQTSDSTPQPSPDNGASYGTVIAEWIAIKYNHKNKEFEVVRIGPIVKCRGVHGDITKTDASFFSCKSASQLHALADALGLTFDDVSYCGGVNDFREKSRARDIRQCLVDALQLRTGDSSRVAKVDSALTSARNSKDDASTTTFWFSCLAGCCTADAELQSRLQLTRRGL